MSRTPAPHHAHHPESRSMTAPLYRLAVLWTVLGLVGGLGYRELTRSHGFTGSTQLAVVHTHLLVLGTLMMLLLLGLEQVFRLSARRSFRVGVWVWTAGVAVTGGMQAVNGTRTVLGHGVEVPPALAGISGLGHILLTVGFVLLFVALGRAVRDQQPATAVVPA